jgi:predicted metal-dependent hydrolase
MLFRLKPARTDTIPADIGGLRVRPSARARRMSLRVEAKTGHILFIWPLKGRVTMDKALRFIEKSRDWIERQQKQAVAPKSFSNGAAISIEGRDVTIRHATGRGLTRLEDDVLVVHGAPEHLPRRVKDFLKKRAAETLARLTAEKAQSLGLKARPVRIRDPKSRWGSCGPDGDIMYSWRLLLAPYDVMDYVVAHEVAHRLHMNHSKNFWRVCLSLAPKGAAARRWLRAHGRELLSYQ